MSDIENPTEEEWLAYTGQKPADDPAYARICATIFQPRRERAARIEELEERNRMLSDIALSAVALKLNIEHGFKPSLHALNRDLDAFQRRFGGVNARHESTDKPGTKEPDVDEGCVGFNLPKENLLCLAILSDEIAEGISAGTAGKAFCAAS